jgi:hypothetical protein
MQRSIRFPDELDARIRALSEADDRSFSYVVVRALESALGAHPPSVGVKGKGATPGPSGLDAEARSAPSRASARPDYRELAMERQRKMNERKS